MYPSPEQDSHRPPFTLKENLPALYPLLRASGTWANNSLMGVNVPVYVAGLLLGVLPIGDWSMLTTLSICSKPSMILYFPGLSFER